MTLIKNVLSVEESLTKLKYKMLKQHPFYGQVLIKLDNARENSSISTAATNGKCLIYNRDFIDSLDEGEKNFVWMHELYHIILMHASRRGNRDPYLWNICADVLVNYLLKVASDTFTREGISFKMPKSAVFMQGVDKISTELLYERWLESYKEQKSQFHSDLSSALESGPSSGSGDGKSQETESNSTSINASYTFEFDDNKITVPAAIDIDLLPDESSNEKLSDDVKKMLREARISSRGLGGSTPIEEMVEKLVGTKIKWQNYLKRFLTAALSDDTSYSSPERKYLWRKQIFPGPFMEDRALDRVLFAIDESGSVGKDLMADFIYQVDTICKDYDIPADVLFWDTKVTSRQQVESNKVYDLKVTGTGGTDVDCVFQYIKDNKIDVFCLIVLTDGYCGVPHTKQYKNKTIFVTLDDSNISDLEPYGKVISAF